MQIFTWLLTALSLLGVVMNIRKHRGCFYVWSVTNVSWCVVDYHKGLTAQAVLFGIYFLLAIWGLWEWKR